MNDLININFDFTWIKTVFLGSYIHKLFLRDIPTAKARSFV